MSTMLQTIKFAISKLPSLVWKSLVWIFIFLLTSCTNPEDPAQSVKIVLSPEAGAVAQRASKILVREITERSGAKVSTEGKADFTVELALESGIGNEGYTIADDGSGILKITGNDENGLLYGVGKFLHTSRYDQSGFTPGDWRGTSVPKGTFRGIYFATHFNNWYEAASDTERARYVESLALWGTNSLLVHYPDQWLSGIDDPKARAWIQKMKRMMADAKSVGIKVGLLHIVNAGYTSTPKELKATPGSHCGGNMVCPSKPEGKNLLMRNWNALMNEFADPGLDLVVYWPYDEGGCNCAQCRPWGGNGYLKLCRDFSTVLREKYPEARIILSTWCFDYRQNPEWKVRVPSRENGEYAALAKALAEDKSWVDGIMTDAHGSFPEYPLIHGVAGGLPMVNFSEISMIGQYPWGGFGANSLPGRLQRLWNEAMDELSGGFPYSEGIFEDINKTICSQLYWAPDKPTMETVKEYIAYEYSPAVVDSVARAIQLLEQGHMRKLAVEKKEKPDADWFSENTIIGGSRIEFIHADQTPLTEAEMKNLKMSTEEAFRLIDGADKQLTPQVRASWRWRILYLRAVIDRELMKTDGWFEGPELKAAFEGLTKISHSEHGFTGIHVPRSDDPNVKY